MDQQAQAENSPAYVLRVGAFTTKEYVRTGILTAAFIALGYLFGLIFTTLFGSGLCRRSDSVRMSQKQSG